MSEGNGDTGNLGKGLTKGPERLEYDSLGEQRSTGKCSICKGVVSKGGTCLCYVRHHAEVKGLNTDTNTVVEFSSEEKDGGEILNLTNKAVFLAGRENPPSDEEG